MESKINVLFIYTDTMGGVGFYRSTQPHEMLSQMYPDDFNVVGTTTPNFMDLHSFDQYQIIHFHKGVFFQMKEQQKLFTNFLKYCKEKGIVTVMDIDDHWKLGMHHPQFKSKMTSKVNSEAIDLEEVVKDNLKLADYVTTTTPFFAKVIKPFNNNVVIFPNAINPEDERFKVVKQPCEKLRIGFIMGSTHEHDMMIMENFVGKLSKDILDKVEFVLCGFDTRGTMQYIKPDGTQEVRPLKPEESVWYRYEQMVTNNYKIVSPQYKAFLERFIKDAAYTNAEQEGYKRCWTKDMNHYYQHYKEIDVLFAPLEENEFNLVKSELKPVECCFSHTAFVGSNYGPYTIGLKNLFKKGGEIDPEGNAILIDRNKSHKDWAKTVERLVKHPEYVKILQDNLYKDYHEKYDLRTVTKQRAEFYKEIVKK